MESKWDHVFDLLNERKYPPGFSKIQKSVLRRYARKFTIKNRDLYFNGRRAVKTQEEAWGLFQECHTALGHTGMVKTRQAMCSRFYWHGMTIQIDKWVSECDGCVKLQKKPTTPVKSDDKPKLGAVWELVVLDLLGPLPQTISGHKFILTATDCFSKWVEAFPLKTPGALEVAQCLCSLIYRHGCPKRFLCTQDQDYIQLLNSTVCSLLNVQRNVAVHLPHTNAVDAHSNHNLKRSLMKVVNEQPQLWDSSLEAVLFSIRAKVHSTTKYTPFQLMYGREAVFPCELPTDMQLSNMELPGEQDYEQFFQKTRDELETKRNSAGENIEEKQQLYQRSKESKKRASRLTGPLSSYF